MYPEEKLAERLVKKRNLIPPFDLYKLVSEFADIEETEFPVPGDGMSIGLGAVLALQFFLIPISITQGKNSLLLMSLGM